MYVEPFAKQELKQEEKLRRPVLELLKKFVDEGTHGIVVVKANFGHGKSLSARTLAWRLAEERF
jgi:Mrp family chromosome partitioning ATPase